MSSPEKTRFDARLTREQKELFEYASQLTGSRSLTDFIISSAQKEAEKVIEKNQFLLVASRQDQQVFFEAIMNPPKPHPSLKKALKRYTKFRSDSGR